MLEWFHQSRKIPKRKIRKKRVGYPCRLENLVVTVTSILPMAVIAALEVLYQFSVDNMGVIDVASDDAVISYAIRSASLVVALILATVLNTLDSVVSVFLVFSIL